MEGSNWSQIGVILIALFLLAGVAYYIYKWR